MPPASDLRQLTILPVPGVGTEDVLIGHDGTAYTGTADGSIFAVSADGDIIRRVAATGGRPLGLEWLPEAQILVCDAHRGLLTIGLFDGSVRVLADSVDGISMKLCNNAAVLDNGDIWFSDSSIRYGVDNWKSDLIDDTCTGRLLRLRAGDTQPEVILDGLSFANGVARTADDCAVIVAETGHRTLRRVHLTGPFAGTDDVFVDDLPAYPDNIALGSDGLIWVTYASPTDPAVTFLQTKAPRWLRTAVRVAPEPLKTKPKRTVRVAAYDADGMLVHDLSAEASSWHMPTGVREHHGRVWLGSLVEPAIAYFDL